MCDPKLVLVYFASPLIGNISLKKAKPPHLLIKLLIIIKKYSGCLSTKLLATSGEVPS